MPTVVEDFAARQAAAAEGESTSRFDELLAPFRTALGFNRNLLFGGSLGGSAEGGFVGGAGGGGGGGLIGDGSFGSTLQPFPGGGFPAPAAAQGTGGGIIGDIGGIAGQFGGFAQGFDPVLDAQRDRALNLSRQQLARRGLEGSSIGANEAARINQGFVEQGLSQRRADLGAQAGLLGQQAGLAEGGANLELALPSIDIARTAAENAGQGGGKK